MDGNSLIPSTHLENKLLESLKISYESINEDKFGVTDVSLSKTENYFQFHEW